MHSTELYISTFICDVNKSSIGWQKGGGWDYTMVITSFLVIGRMPAESHVLLFLELENVIRSKYVI